MNTWNQRIKLRMQELGLTHEQLAGRMGVTRGAITHYLAGRRVPPLRQFQKLASILKVDPAWLQYGSIVKQPAPKPIPVKQKHFHIPIISFKQAADCVEISKLKTVETIPHFFTDSPEWYAIKVQGDSMVSNTGQRSFHEGDFIIIDPNKTAKHGDFVIAILPKAKEATFKQYVIDSGRKYLKPLNTQYPLLEIDSKARIIGVVVQCIC